MDMAEKRFPVGLIGIGLMVMACARRLLGAGFEVLGYDVDAAKLAGLQAAGGRAARSLAEIATTCRKVVLAVFNTDQVEEVVGALLAALPADAPPLTAICVSTCDPDRIAALAGRLPAQRLRYVEASISGSSDQAARGEGLGLLGGE